MPQAINSQVVQREFHLLVCAVVAPEDLLQIGSFDHSLVIRAWTLVMAVSSVSTENVEEPSISSARLVTWAIRIGLFL
jgi:hypothetical protein